MQNEAQLKRQLKRRKAKKRRKAGEGGGDADGAEEEAEEGDGAEEVVLSAADAYQPLAHLRAPHKLHSFAFMPRQAAAAAAAAAGEKRTRDVPAKLLVADRSNSLTVYACELKQGGGATTVGSLSSAGHRNEPRSLALSTDDRLLLSAADGEAKVWSLRSRQCIGTLGCGAGISALFMLANKFAVVGTKTGELQLFCLATGEMVDQVSAHGGAVWSIALLPGGTPRDRG